MLGSIIFVSVNLLISFPMLLQWYIKLTCLRELLIKAIFSKCVHNFQRFGTETSDFKKACFVDGFLVIFKVRSSVFENQLCKLQMSDPGKVDNNVSKKKHQSI